MKLSRLCRSLLPIFSIALPSLAYGVCDNTQIIEISIKNKRFDPPTIEVCLGQTVKWTNNEEVGPRLIKHTVTADPARARRAEDVLLPDGVEAFDSGILTPGDSWEYTFNVLGDYKYFCRPHELMGHLGSIKVVEELTPEQVPVPDQPVEKN